MDYEEALRTLDSVNQITPTEFKETELAAIADLACKIGLYEWKYEPGVTGETELHIGPIAQDLLRVPGLASAVKNENGVITIDTKFVALAALSYCATLTRILTGLQYEKREVKE